MNQTVQARRKTAHKNTNSAPSESSNRIFMAVLYALLAGGLLLIGGIVYTILIGTPG